jgi:hypothetical protein
VQLRRVKVYRNIDLRQTLFGVEAPDFFVLGALFAVLIIVNNRGFGLNMLIELCAYVGLRAVKRGKPDGWSTAIAKFYLRPPFYSAAARDVVGAATPFPFAGARADVARPERSVR